MRAGPRAEPLACSRAPSMARSGRYNEWRDGDDEPGPDNGRVMFVNATDNTTDLSNALALDMTYRVLYYGHFNKVEEGGGRWSWSGSVLACYVQR